MNAATLSDADLLDQAVSLEGDLDVAAARALLRLTLRPGAKSTVRRLLAKNQRGTITTEERLQLEQYLRLGQLLDLVQAKARLALRSSEN